MADPSELAELGAVLAQYGLERRGEARRVSGGTLNRNYRVETDQGVVFVRRHRSELTLDRIRAEHAVTSWVADRGIPAVTPIALDDGDTVVEVRAALWAVFPWVEGRTLVRGAASPRQIEALGEMHGRIQQALAEHPRSSDADAERALREALAWDTDASIERLEVLEPRVREQPEWQHLADGLSLQRQMLEGGAARDASEFAWLPSQLLHGDFHDDQVLVDATDQVVAVVDWELARVALRVWELIRSLSFSLILETELVDDYLRGYARHVRLTAEECRAGVELWWQTRLHGTWVWEAYFLEGNERVGALLDETDAHLRRFADAGWRSAIAERLIAGIGAS